VDAGRGCGSEYGTPTFATTTPAKSPINSAVGYFFGTLVLKLNPALLLGSVTGAMTSTPALNILNEETKSAVPALGYSGTHTIANVLLIHSGSHSPRPRSI
jgi:uncharacterized transporter YbjL